MSRKLHDYQQKQIRRVKQKLSKFGSVVLQLPTAGGKTLEAAHLIHSECRKGTRVWFVVHRRELVAQSSREMTELGISHGVIAGGWLRSDREPVQICSVHSLRARVHTLKAPGLIVWDECHHVAAESWAAVFKRFPKARHLGLTATPERP